MNNGLFSVVEVETISACNLRCGYCPNSIYDRGRLENTRRLPSAVFYKLVDELAEIGFAGELHPHFYNEPLLDRRLETFVAYARKALPLVRIVLYSNGTLMTVKRYLTLVRAGVSEFKITCHDSKKTAPLTQVVDYRKRTGFNGVSLCYCPRGIGPGEVISNRGGLIRLGTVTDTMDRCNLPSQYVTIDCEGNLILCCNDYFGSFRFGSIKTERLMEIWNRPHNVALRAHLREDTSKIEICRKCRLGTRQ